MLGQVADSLSSSGIPKSVEQIEERIRDQRFSPFVPVPIAGDVPETLKIWIDEHADELPSIAAERVAVRSYPYGSLAAHVIGYTGKVTKAELDEVDDALKKAKPYSLNDEIGKYGHREVVRGRAPRQARAAPARGRRRGQPRPRSSTRTRRSRATTSSSTST